MRVGQHGFPRALPQDDDDSGRFDPSASDEPEGGSKLHGDDVVVLKVLVQWFKSYW